MSRRQKLNVGPDAEIDTNPGLSDEEKAKLQAAQDRAQSKLQSYIGQLRTLKEGIREYYPTATPDVQAASGATILDLCDEIKTIFD